MNSRALTVADERDSSPAFSPWDPKDLAGNRVFGAGGGKQNDAKR